jgi:hypothetical protein
MKLHLYRLERQVCISISTALACHERQKQRLPESSDGFAVAFPGTATKWHAVLEGMECDKRQYLCSAHLEPTTLAKANHPDHPESTSSALSKTPRLGGASTGRGQDYSVPTPGRAGRPPSAFVLMSEAGLLPCNHPRRSRPSGTSKAEIACLVVTWPRAVTRPICCDFPQPVRPANVYL